MFAFFNGGVVLFIEKYTKFATKIAYQRTPPDWTIRKQNILTFYTIAYGIVKTCMYIFSKIKFIVRNHIFVRILKIKKRCKVLCEITPLSFANDVFSAERKTIYVVFRSLSNVNIVFKYDRANKKFRKYADYNRTLHAISLLSDDDWMQTW